MNEWLYTVNYNSPLPSGVYAIVNVVNGWRYVGSTTDLTRRASQHFRALEDGTHHNRNLQYSFDVFRPYVFTFVVLEYCEPDQLLECEQRWLNRLKHKAFNRQWKVRRPAELVGLEEMNYVYKDKTVSDDDGNLPSQQ